MQQGENTTYIRYTLKQGSLPLTLSFKALVNYRDHHSDTHNNNWQMQINSIDAGIKVQAMPNASNLYLLASARNDNKITWKPNHIWYHNFSLAVEKYRGLIHCEDHLLAGTCTVTLNKEDSITIVASTKSDPNLDDTSAWKERYTYEQKLLTKAFRIQPESFKLTQSTPPKWISKLVLAANQFIVDRPTVSFSVEKTIITGYPWFSDGGRNTMISLPGLTLVSGRPSVARSILRTFAKYVDQGMLPNVFPDGGKTANSTTDTNTVDTALWYFEAIFAYYKYTQDREFIKELFPVLAKIINDYCQGTSYIHCDSDGLLYAEATEVELTWMDAQVGDWVVTPRIGKPIEINALWYNALVIMMQFAKILNQPEQKYAQLARAAQAGFQRFWSDRLGYCYDVIDTSDGNDSCLRPNQIFAVSLPSLEQVPSLLTANQQKSVVDLVAQELVTPCGLRSLSANHPDYQGQYGGDRQKRAGSYHQGTIWAWLIGHFIQAHLKVYQQPKTASDFLAPMADLLETGCVGQIGEIFDGDPPFSPRGCFSQASSVAEVLRSWQLIKQKSEQELQLPSPIV